VKRILTLVLALSLLSVSAQANASWKPSPPPTSDPYWGILAQGIVQSYATFAGPALLSFTADRYVLNEGKVLTVDSCSTFPNDACPESEYQRYVSPMGMCKNYEKDCVEEVFAFQGGKKLEVNFQRYFPMPTSQSFKGNSSFNLPTSGSTFLVSIPEAPHTAGDQYLVSSVLDGARLPNQAKFETGQMQIAIWPVQIVSGVFPMYQQSLDPTKYSGLGVSTGASDTRCTGVQSTGTECAIPVTPPKGLSLGLEVRLATKVGGWFHGRITSVDAEVRFDQNGDQIIKILGESVVVPTIHGWVPKGQAPAGLKKFYDEMDPFFLNMGNGYGCIGQTTDLGPCNPREWVSVLRNPGVNEEGMQELSYWIPVVEDKAATEASFWFIRSIQGDITGQCRTPNDRLVGVVTTNATTYLPGPPRFDNAQQTLDYKVLAPHYLSDGREFLGTYDLVMDSALARCVYGFVDAPISATVSIISDDETKVISSTVLTEKEGFLFLGASGFTFSAPTVRISLSQEAPKASPATSEESKSTVTESAQSSSSETVIAKPSKKSVNCTKAVKNKKTKAKKANCKKTTKS
jgi:hypothetical protein